MKFLEKIFDKKRADFEKGGKLEFFYPLFEAKETFLFVLGRRTKDGGVHIRDNMDSKRLMSIVVQALIPCLLFGIYNAGYQFYAGQGTEASILECFAKGLWYGPEHKFQGVLPILITSYAVGGVCELIFALIRKHEINEGFLVTGMLLPLTLPPTIPIWMVALGVIFGVVIGKEIFGGTGMNIFNPALTARAFLFFAYAPQMSGDAPWIMTGAESFVDGFTSAPPLALVYAHATDAAASTGIVEALTNSHYTWTSMFLGRIPGSIGETSTLLCFLGAGLLIATGIGSWRVMLATLIGCVGMASLMNICSSSDMSMLSIPAHYHIVMGGFAFGMVYMATDPVSAAQTNAGKWVYGILIGCLLVIIRVINPAYPEGMMLSILFLNAFAPLIDYCVLQLHIAKRANRVTKAHHSNTEIVIIVAVLAVVCAFALSIVSSSLRDKVAENKKYDVQKSILDSFKLIGEGEEELGPEEKLVKGEILAFIGERLGVIVVNTKGDILSKEELAGFLKAQKVSLDEKIKDEVEQKKAAIDEAVLRQKLKNDHKAFKNETVKDMSLPVFILYKKGSDKSIIDAYAIPVWGKGLWGPIRGYLSIEPDGRTVRYLTMLGDHSETPGLGKEMERKWFRGNFTGKKTHDDTGKLVAITVVKGKAPADAKHKVTGLSGATITSVGITKMTKKCLGLYEKYFDNVAKNAAKDAGKKPDTNGGTK